MRRLTGIVPTLLLIGLAPASLLAGDAVSATERDAHFEAVRSLVEREFRLPAKRQLAEFSAAGYPDAEWFAKALAWSYADRFRVLSPDKAEKEALAKQVATLGKELETNKAKLPKAVADMFGGTGKILRLVTDILRMVDPDQPLGITGLQGIPDEQRAAVVQAVQTLAVEAKAAFTQAAAQIKANAAADEKALADNNMKGIEAATIARLEAVRPVYLARKALREVAERGKEYGLDPAPAEKFLQEFATANFKVIQDWDYAYGDFHPYLHVFCIELAADAIRFKVKTAAYDDIEADLIRTVEIDAGKEYAGAAGVADEVRTLQAKAWAGIITWYRDLGRTLGPKHWQRGLEQWQAFKEKTKNDRHFRLDHPNRERATEMARVYIAAARLLRAKGDDTGAVAVLNQITSVKDQPLAQHAKLWVQYILNPPGGGQQKADWGETPVASEPSGALDAAKALLRVADQTGDEVKAYQFRLRAAAALRSGVLGLATPPADQAAQDRADEAAPELWFRYSSALNALGLRWHAAVVAQEGLKSLKGRLAELPKDAPVWRNKDGSWTKAGNFISLLSRNGIFYAQSLLSRARGSATSDLYNGTVSLVQEVSPTDAGKSLERLKLLLLLSEKEWNQVLEETKGYVKKYPEDSFWAVSSLTIPALQGKRADSKSADDRKRIEGEMIALAESTAAKAVEELKKSPNDERRRELNAVPGDVLLVKAMLQLDDKPGEVLGLLGTEYWAKPPVDEDKAIRALGYMCQAVIKYYGQRAKDEKVRTDGKALLADWARYQTAYEIWRKQKARLPGRTEDIEARGASLAQTFVNLSNWAEQLAARPGAPADLAQVPKEARRAFSDMIEPRLTEASDPNTVFATADIIWNLGEHTRAARLMQVFVNQIAKDPDAAALRDTPKEVLAPIGTLISARPELKAAWEKVRDLLEDAPGLAENILTQDLAQDKWGEAKIDYVKAIAAVRGLREECTKRRIEIGATYPQIDEGLKKLEGAVIKLAREITMVSNLALAYREMGQVEKANDLYNRLISYDPVNPEYLAAAVELVIQQIKAEGKVPEAKVIEATQIKAARVRDAAQSGSPTYWTAVIQVLELANLLKDTKSIDKRLIFDAQNRSTPADDMQLLPREPRDDKRVRRARNVMAVDLCRRYLAVFGLPGVNAKPSFRIDTVEIDGSQTVIFVPAEDGLKFAPHKRVLDDGTTVWFLWEAGKEPPPEPAAAPPPPAAKEDAKPADKPAEPAKEKKP